MVYIIQISKMKSRGIYKKVYVMKNTVSDKWKATFQETKQGLYREAIANQMEWEDEVDGDFSTEVEFLLGLKGRWLLCHIRKDYPYTIRFRLIWEKDYEKSKPKDFITLAKQKLLH